jgi:hypothetical protein
MHETPIADAVEIIDDALVDLAGAGCAPLDRAAALLAAGCAELEEAGDIAGSLAVYRMLLEHVCTTLAAIQDGTGGAPSRAVH